MAEPFPFELVSPAKQLIAGEALEVTVPGTEGYFQVLANHSPLMATIKPGIIDVKMSDGKDTRFIVFGGFADVSPAGCTILAEHAIATDAFDKADLEARIKSAEAGIEQAKDDNAKSKAIETLDHLTSLKAAL